MTNMSTAGEILTQILSKDTDCILFLHNTKIEETARKIQTEGFSFEEQLAYSTDRVNPKDSVEINYFMVERKEYGIFTIIIQIDKELFKKYNYLAESADIHFEELFTIKEPVLSDNDEYVYLLSPHYIKGYFNNKTGELISNPLFDPRFESQQYLKNFNKLRGE